MSEDAGKPRPSGRGAVTSQGELFDAPSKRRRPAYKETSRKAWESIKPTVSGELDRLIVEAIWRSGPAGITCDKIEARIGRSHQAVSANLRHLVEKNIVRFSGGYGSTKSGRKARLWVIV